MRQELRRSSSLRSQAQSTKPISAARSWAMLRHAAIGLIGLSYGLFGQVDMVWADRQGSRLLLEREHAAQVFNLKTEQQRYLDRLQERSSRDPRLTQQRLRQRALQYRQLQEHMQRTQRQRALPTHQGPHRRGHEWIRFRIQQQRQRLQFRIQQRSRR
jgi:hypothetical protein